jgi:hypothetical protein
MAFLIAIRRSLRYAVGLMIIAGGAALVEGFGFGQEESDSGGHRSFAPVIPQTWDEEALQTLELPLANPAYSPVHVPASYYYQIPERPIYKSYPVYTPGHEPAGYWQRLHRAVPEVIWGKDDQGIEHRPPLQTEADWVRAGELVFDAAISYSAGPGFLISLANMRDPQFFATLQPPVSADGVFPFGSYLDFGHPAARQSA